MFCFAKIFSKKSSNHYQLREKSPNSSALANNFSIIIQLLLKNFQILSFCRLCLPLSCEYFRKTFGENKYFDEIYRNYFRENFICNKYFPKNLRKPHVIKIFVHKNDPFLFYVTDKFCLL